MSETSPNALAKILAFAALLRPPLAKV
ncbi:hypothetical protein ACCAA_1050001 [Candidatus Accumulibacter aalborgensis]|uniref:Uncharacterized protein n=1 Tax=Candidatus Accumulibacter aalborgensis TaxID=1860102 RepID=A0A1A8XE87_9PROT|nr:hypothetical protein ACCAA_1050001 [Candidatus Accumulibacter aalborgensis]